MELFERRTELEVPAGEVFQWHLRPGAFERLKPPWDKVKVLAQDKKMTNGSRVVLQIQVGPFSKRWIAEHRDIIEGRQFKDVQIAGPFAHWVHTHRMEPTSPTSCTLVDQIEYALPLGPAGRLLGGAFTREKLQRMFQARHETTRHDLGAHLRYGGTTAMKKIAVTGASGLMGSALVPFLTTGGHEVLRVVRRTPRPGQPEIHWQPEDGRIAIEALEGVDVVVHLAGENIASSRWTASRKTKIRDSRWNGTRLLSEALAGLDQPPKALISASAIGFYGDRGDEELSESSQSGKGFLAEVCRGWEDATQPAREKGIRVINTRFGVILSPEGGALAKMLTPFKLGVGGVLGSGQQYMSWIDIDDAVGAVHHVLMTEELAGPVNVVAPNAVTNRELTKTLGKVLSRPTVLPMPAFAARLAFGEMADEMLLSSARVQPRRLLDTGYTFRYPQLEPSLRHLLGR